MPLLDDDAIKKYREMAQQGAGEKSSAPLNPAVLSHEAIANDVASRMKTPGGLYLDLATEIARAQNRNKPPITGLPLDTIVTREEQLESNYQRDPTFLRDLGASAYYDIPRDLSDKWVYEQGVQDMVDAGKYGNTADIRFLEQHGFDLQDILDMTPEQRAKQVRSASGGSLGEMMRGGPVNTSFAAEKTAPVKLTDEISRRLFGTEGKGLQGIAANYADVMEPVFAQRPHDGGISGVAHDVARSLPSMVIRRLPEMIVRSVFGDASAVPMAILSGIWEAGGEGGRAYREAQRTMSDEDALKAGLTADKANRMMLIGSNALQAHLANRYLPKVADYFKGKGTPSYSKAFDLVMDSATQAAEETTQNVIGSVATKQPVNRGEAAYEGFIAMVSSLATAGIAAGRAKAFGAYTGRRMAGDAKEYWEPRIQKLVNEGRAGGNGYSRENAMEALGISPDSFDPKKVYDVPLEKNAYAIMLQEEAAKEDLRKQNEEAKKLAKKLGVEAPVDAEKAAQLEGEEQRRKAEIASRKFLNTNDTNPTIGQEDNGAKPARNAYDPIKQEDFEDPEALQIFMNNVFDNRTIRAIDKETRDKITLMAKDRFFNYRTEKQLPIGQKDIPENELTGRKAAQTRNDRHARSSLEKFYGIVYDTIPENQRAVGSKREFINRNISISNWAEANTQMQREIAKKARQKRDDKIAELQKTGSDPTELARLIAEKNDVKARVEDFNSPGFSEPTETDPLTGEVDAQKEKAREQSNISNLYFSAKERDREIAKAIGGNNSLDADSDLVDVADRIYGFKDGRIGILLEKADLTPDEASRIEGAVVSLNAIAADMGAKGFSPEVFENALAEMREAVHGIASRKGGKGWSITDTKYSDDAFQKVVEKIGNKHGVDPEIMRDITERLDELNKVANEVKIYTTDKWIKNNGRKIIKPGIRPATETSKLLLKIAKHKYDLSLSQGVDQKEKAMDIEHAIERDKEDLFKLYTSGDMTEYIRNEMPVRESPNPKGGNIPDGIPHTAILKAIESLQKEGKTSMADRLLAMWVADDDVRIAREQDAKDVVTARERNARSDEAVVAIEDWIAEAFDRVNLENMVRDDVGKPVLGKDGKPMYNQPPLNLKAARDLANEIADLYTELAGKNKGRSFILTLAKRLEDARSNAQALDKFDPTSKNPNEYFAERQLKEEGKKFATKEEKEKAIKGRAREIGIQARDRRIMLENLDLQKLGDLLDKDGIPVVPMSDFQKHFPSVTRLQSSKKHVGPGTAIRLIRDWENADLDIREERMNRLDLASRKESVPEGNVKPAGEVDPDSGAVFGDEQHTDITAGEEWIAKQNAQPADTEVDTFPLGAVAGQEIRKEPSSARTGWTGKILSVFHKGDAKNPAAFNTYFGRMQKFIAGKESILSKSIEAIRDASLKSPEIKAQVDNIFNYSLDRNVSLDGVDSSVRQHVENVLNSLKEVMNIRKEAGLKGGPKRSSDITRGIIHDMRDNPNFVPDPEALKDFALGTMRDGTVSSFEEGLALAHNVLSRQAWGDMRLNTMPKYAQELLGYNPDPMVQLYLNSRKLVRDTARQIFERDLLADTKVVADTQLEPDYVQLISNRNTNERYYSLEGKWVPPEVAAMLHQESKARSEIVKSYLMLHSMFKQMKIIYSTTSYVNNFFGNFFLMQMGGIPLHHSMKAYPKAVKEVYSWLHDGKISPRLKEAIDAGLFEGTMTLSELSLSDNDMDAMSKLKDDDLQGINRILFKGLNKLENNKVGKFGRTMYEGIEQVHRYVAYQYFRDVGHTTDLASGSLDPTKPFASFVKNLNPMRKKTAMDPAHAVAQVDKTLFNYRDLPSGVKFLRDTGIPFISFPYLAGKSFLRNTVENPTGIIAMVLTGTLLREAVRGASGGEKELELEGWIPYWELIDPLQRSNNRYGESMLDAILGNFTPGGPLMIPYELMTGEKMFGGFPIAEKSGKEPTAGDMGRHVADVMMPAAFSSAIRNVEKYSQGKDSGANLLFRQFGVRLRDSDTGRLRKDLSALKFRARDKVRDFKSGKISESELRDSLIRIKQSENNLRDQYGEVLGVGPYSK